ncbi:DUF1003 domain-containing protein [Pararobbsia alpina]|uniref:DUF1003 domain-containing protein n=1 Tax=Pararobbsia alpina TaxID=621374 RepID=UPI0039A5C4F8
MPNFSKLYLAFRQPRVFLVALVTFVAVSLVSHFLHHYDPDFGATNLILSIEASIASAMLMVVAEESAEMQRRNSADQARMLAAVLAMAEAQRDMLASQTDTLRAMRDTDERIYNALTNGEQHGMAR